MSWLDDLKRRVTSVAAPVMQSAPVRMAGRALQSSFVRPMIGFKPEIGGIIASELLPKQSPVKALVDTGLYLASGPLNTALALGGSTPQSDDPYGRWQQLGYASRDDMARRIAEQKQRDTRGQVPNKLPGVYIADDYGPPRPVRYQDGGLMIGDYSVTRFDTPAEREIIAEQPERSATPPASRRPAEERRPPVSGRVPSTPTPSSREETRAAVEREMLTRAAQQQRTDDLYRQLVDIGATKGMTEANARTWISKHPGLAERLITDRAGREQRLAEEFKGFSAYL